MQAVSIAVDRSSSSTNVNWYRFYHNCVGGEHTTAPEIYGGIHINFQDAPTRFLANFYSSAGSPRQVRVKRAHFLPFKNKQLIRHYWCWMAKRLQWNWKPVQAIEALTPLRFILPFRVRFVRYKFNQSCRLMLLVARNTSFDSRCRLERRSTIQRLAYCWHWQAMSPAQIDVRIRCFEWRVTAYRAMCQRYRQVLKSSSPIVNRHSFCVNVISNKIFTNCIAPLPSGFTQQPTPCSLQKKNHFFSLDVFDVRSNSNFKQKQIS